MATISVSLCCSSPQPAGKMVAAAKAAVPTVGDQAAALQLGNFAKATAASLAELRAATIKVSTDCLLAVTHLLSLSRHQRCVGHWRWIVLLTLYVD